MTSEFAIAVHALVFLNHKGSCQSSEKIAENVCTNPARIRKILAKLKKAQLVETKEGLEGGYLFCNDPSKVTLAQVCQAVGSTPVSVSWHSGDLNMDCQIASGMAHIMDGIYMQLNDSCYEKLQTMTIAQVDQQIFGSPK